ncbi:unnamed protein product, partial [marine sediment metagenome]
IGQKTFSDSLVSKRNKRWKENNPGKVSEQRRRYYKKNQESFKQYYIGNKGKILEYQKQ